MIVEERKVDPEPITIIAAVAGIVSASIATANFLKTHFKELPSVTRRKLIAELDQVAEDLGHLEVDVSLIEEIFLKAEYPNGRGVRFGNGALVSSSDFARYQRLSDSVLLRLRSLNKHTLRIEGLVRTLSGLIKATPTNQIGDALGSLQSIFQAQDMSVERAWKMIRFVIKQLREMIASIRSDLGR